MSHSWRRSYPNGRLNLKLAGFSTDDSHLYQKEKRKEGIMETSASAYEGLSAKEIAFSL